VEDIFRFADEFGPARIIHVHRAGVGLKAIAVVDNTACGPAIGGIRMAPDVSPEECFRLARAMTWKNAAAGLPHGGGKSVIFGDPKMPSERKEQVVRAFAGAVRDIADYIPGPDMGTDELCMGWVKDETGRAVGLPGALGGIPLDEIGATGYGLAVSIDVTREFIGLELKARGWSCKASERSASMRRASWRRRAPCWSGRATPAARSPIRRASTWAR
jgi:glutamate dehydrogenase/leucine dehydrogenase